MRFRLLKFLVRHWMLLLIEKILGDDIEPEEQKLLAVCYERLIAEEDKLKGG